MSSRSWISTRRSGAPPEFGQRPAYSPEPLPAWSSKNPQLWYRKHSCDSSWLRPYHCVKCNSPAIPRKACGFNEKYRSKCRDRRCPNHRISCPTRSKSMILGGLLADECLVQHFHHGGEIHAIQPLARLGRLQLAIDIVPHIAQGPISNFFRSK